MKNLLLTTLFAMTSLVAMAQKDSQLATQAGDYQVEVTFYSPQIVRVTKWPKGQARPETKSEVVTMAPQENLKVKISNGSSAARLSSDKLSVTVDKKTGLSQFAGGGKNLLKEKATSFTQRTNGTDKGRYEVAMTYQLDKDEAIYGLGTVQDGKLNRRGLTKHIEQSNLEDFQNVIQSIKGWGIYWDNYSRANFEDNSSVMTFKAEVGDCADYYFMY